MSGTADRPHPSPSPVPSRPGPGLAPWNAWGLAPSPAPAEGATLAQGRVQRPAGGGWGFPLVPRVTRVLPLEIKKTENQFMALRIWKKTKEERKKNLRWRKKCPAWSRRQEEEEEEGGPHRAGAWLGVTCGPWAPRPAGGSLPVHAGFPYFVLPFGLTVNKKAGGRGRGWLLSLVPN